MQSYEVLKEHEVNLIWGYESKKVDEIEDLKDKVDWLLQELLEREDEANERISQLQEKEEENK